MVLILDNFNNTMLQLVFDFQITKIKNNNRQLILKKSKLLVITELYYLKCQLVQFNLQII